MEYGLPALTGSEKQVKWATDIRGKFNRAFDSETKQFLRYKTAAKYLTAWKDACNAQTSAKWWIDRRDKLATIAYTSNKLIGYARNEGIKPAEMSPEELGEVALRALDSFEW